MKKAIFAMTLAIVIGLFPTLSLGAVWYVDIDNAGTQDGTGWLTAFTTIQAGIDAAFSDGGGEVWVAEGSYPEAISISSNVILYGGFAGSETQRFERDTKNNPCIINASTAAGGSPAHNVVTMNSIANAGIDGFMITGGVADGWSGSEGYGAGIYGYGLDVTVAIRNCMVIGNTARNGGGIYAYNSTLAIEKCIISSNTALSNGGGLYLNYGAPNLTDCVISGNISNYSAGGGYLYNASATLNNCTISGNTASNSTPGILISGGTPVIANCTISDNGGTTDGGGISDAAGTASIFNTIFHNNTPYAIYSASEAGPVLTHSLFNNNELGDYALIVYDYNTGQVTTDIYTGGNEINLFLPQAENNYDGDPLFVAAMAGTWSEAPVFDSAANHTTLTDASAAFVSETLVGRLINTDTTQGRQALIVANTSTTIQVVGDVSTFAPASADYRIIDYHIAEGSAAIDRGDPANASAEDFEDDPRPGTDGLVDIGVDETDAAYEAPDDTNPPMSMAQAIPDILTVSTCAIPFLAADAESGIKHVDLYFRKDGGDWQIYNGPYTASPIDFDSTAQGGDGYYEFYTRSTDNADNLEAPPDTPDTSVSFITTYAGSRIYVDQDATGLATGLDWDNAFLNLNAAFTIAAGFSVPEIWVAEGTYQAAIVMTSNLSVYGGFEGVETQLNQRDIDGHPTVIDASSANGGTPAYHVVTMVDIINARLDGFTITGGNGDGGNDDSQGGGIFCDLLDASNFIANCVVKENSVNSTGGGIYVRSASPQIIDCEISQNATGGYYGGGISGTNASPIISGCNITNNQGGGVYFQGDGAPIIDDCQITGNLNTYGARFSSLNNLALSRSIIAGNGRSDGYTGLYVDQSGGTINRCMISGNLSGGISGYGNNGLVIENSIISGNPADGVSLSGNFTILNCTLHSNDSGLTINGGNPLIVNSIFANNNDYGINEAGTYDYTPILRANLFNGNIDGGYYDAGTDRTHYEANSINLELAGAERNVSGDPLFAIGPQGTWSEVTYNYDWVTDTAWTTFIDDGASFTAGALIGRLINPDTSQYRQAYIVDNTATTIEVYGDYSSIAEIGEAYRIIDYHLQNGSAALDRGTSTDAPAEDMEGDNRPGDDGLVDIGADEADPAFEPPADMINPISRVAQIPDVITQTLIEISFVSTDAQSGIQYVELFYRKDGGDWLQYGGQFTISPIVFDTSTTGGNGYYEFYTIATDNSGNSEPAKTVQEDFVYIIPTFSGDRAYVDGNTNAYGTGESWVSPVRSINAGLILARTFGLSDVWVARGTYLEAIDMPDGVALYGGFAGNEALVAERDVSVNHTIIDAATADYGRPATHVVLIENVANVRVDGFTITGGDADVDGYNHGDMGGGILAYETGGTIVIANCIITGNFGQGGGGLYADGPRFDIINCVIEDNTAEYAGGAFFDTTVINLSDSIIRNNTAPNEAGGIEMYYATGVIADCEFSGNTTEGEGGGVYIENIDYDQPAPRLTRCVISNNTADVGGGIYADDIGVVEIDQCTITGNRALDVGGGGFFYVCDPHITNSLIAGNQAIIEGGGFEIDYANFIIENTIIAGNDGGEYGGGVYGYRQNTYQQSHEPMLLNSIVSGNQADYGGGIYLDDLSPLVVNCTISSNEAIEGGGLYLDRAQPDFTNTIIEENSGNAVYESNSDGDALLSNSLFYNNADGDYYDYDTSTLLTGADSINALAEAENVLDGDPVFEVGLTGTWSSAPVFDAETNTTRLTDDGAAFVENELADTLLNPNTAQLRQAWIVSNTATAIDVWGDITAFVQSGDTYQLVDYHLQDSSACIDTGTDTHAPNADFEGFYRPVDLPGIGQDATGTEYDLGVYEYQKLDDLFLIPTSPVLVTFGHEGQTFAPSQFTITLQNIGQTPLAWSAAWIETWFDVTPTSGSLNPGETDSVEVTITPDAASLPIGIHSGTINFTNTSNAVEQQRLVEIHVRQNYFTEIFTNGDNDIDYQTLTLTPDGSDHFYSLCRMPAAVFPTDPDGGTALNISSHNSYQTISIQESKQIPFYGTAYTSIRIYANGFLTFQYCSSNSAQESLQQHFACPRVSGLYDDLDPMVYGRISWKQLEDRVAVTYENVPEYEVNGSNSFQVELFFDGVITITHLEIDAADGLIGLSEGLGVPEDFIESDLSEYACAQGTVTFLSEFYTNTDDIDLELADADLSGTGTQTLTITSTRGDSEDVTMTETSTGLGIFTGSLASVSGTVTSGNGVLEVSDGDSINVTYHDADDGSGNPADVIATAHIDSQPVSVSNVAVTDVGPFQVTVAFETDEPATATVYYGPIAGSPDNSMISDTLLQTSHTVVLPGLLHDTPYFFEAQATDVAGNITTDDNGGIYYAFTTLSLPNLIASDVSAPAEAASGQTISLTWTVTNGGDEPGLGTWYDRIYISDDDLPGNDTYLTLVTRLAELPVGNSYQQTRNVSLPDVGAGTYWIVVEADGNHAVSELDENDNAAVSGPIVIGQPNLVVSDLAAPDQTYAGANVNVVWTVTNTGADDASGSWYDMLYLAENEQLTGTRHYLGNYHRPTELAPAAFYERSVQVTIPSHAVGDYYFVVQTDDGNSVNETDETDNRASYGPVVVGQPNLTLSDVVVPATLITGRSNEFSWTVTNTSSVPVTVDWIDRVYLSSDDQIGDDLELGSIHRPTGLDPAEQYVSDEAIYMPGMAAGNYWVVIKADGWNWIGESTEDDNTIITGPVAVTGPDLIVASLQAPTDIYVGEAISIDWTIENIGGAEALGNWDDTIYLSDDDQVGDDQGLYTDSRLSELDVGASYDASFQLAVPGVAAGTYWLVVVTDRWGANAEINENNNTAIFGPITIRRPNLTTTNVQIPAEMWTRQDYNLSWTVTNNGTVPTVRTWRDAVYLSTDDQIGGDTLLDEIECPVALEAGQLYDRALTVTIPEIASGDYWIIIRSDNNGVIPETDEGDNVFAAGPIPVRTTPYANLQVSQAEFAVSEVDIGQQFTVDWEVVNVGIGPTSASFWKDRIYVSVDESLDITDTKIGERGNVSYLNSGENYTSTTVVTIGGTSEADYYILVKTDATDEVYEYQSEEDNVFVAGQVHVSLPPPVDFIVTSVMAPALAFSGQPFAMTYQVLNVGVDVGDLASWYDDVYLSEDTVLDTNADHRIARVLRVAASSRNPDPPYNVDYTANIDAVPPVGLSGTFYVFVDTDGTNRINEWAFENNNTAYDDSPIEITLTPPPDLEIVDIIPPIDATAGRSFTLSYSVRNSGSTRTPNDRWTDAFYLSSDATLDVQNDVLLVRRTVTFYGDPGGLDVDQTYTRDETLNAPVDTPTGDYTLFVVTDYYDQVFELDNANNISLSAISIESRPADLVVDSIQGNTDVEAGKAFTLRWTVRNQGPGDSITTTWYDRIAVTQNDIAGDGDDISLREFRHDGRLYPNQSYPATGTVTIPFSLSGDYFVYVRTDSRGHVYEGVNGNANNVSDLHPITIERFIPDLSATAASSTIENGKINVQWTVENIGENRTNTNYWRDAIVASTNDTYGDADDIQLSSAAHSGYLEATASYTNALTVSLPAAITSDVYLFVEANYSRKVDEGGLYGNNAIQAGVLTAADIQAMRTTPDFIVESVSAPLDAIAGQTFEVDWTVHNVGEFLPQQAPFPPEAAKGVWVDRVYLSRDTFLDPAEDIYIGQEIVYAGELVDVTGGDSPYQMYSKTASLRVPDGLTGPFYLIINVDRSNLVAEPGGEDNNIGYDAQALLVTLAPVVDLVVGTITIPANVSVGSRLTIDYTLENQSDSDVTGDWSDLYYLSTDAAIDFDDVELGTSHRSAGANPLPAQGSTDISTYFSLPGVMPGDYYVILRTDAFNQIREADELNNFGISQSQVSIDMPALATDYLDGRAPIETELTWLNGGRASFYYKLEVADGAGLTLIPEWLLSDGQNRHTQVSAYVAHDRIPTMDDYDYFETHWLISGSAGELSVAPLTLTGLDAGMYYILLELQGLGMQEFETRSERFDLVIDPVQTVTEVAVEIDVELSKQQVKGYYYSFDTLAGKTLMLSPHWLYLNRKISHQDNIIYDRLALTKIYVAFNRIATPYDYDFIDDRFLQSTGFTQPAGDSPLIIPKSKAGTYYVYVEIHDAHSPWSTPYINGLKAIEYTQERFNVILSELPFTLLVVEPDSVGNAGKATLALIASNLDLCSTIELVQNDQVVKHAEDIFIPDPEVPKAYVRFDLEGLPPGSYDIRVTDRSGAASSKPIDIMPGLGPQIGAALKGPNEVRWRDYIFYVNYGNSGDADGIAPLLIVENLGTNSFEIQRNDLTSEAVPAGGIIQLLGIGYDGPAGILRPGELGSIPVFFRTTFDDGNFRLQVITADDPRPLYFEDIEDQVRPMDLTDEEWAEIRPRLMARIGDTWGSYVRALSKAANEHQSLDGRSFIVNEIFTNLYYQAVFEKSANVYGYVIGGDDCQTVSEAVVTSISSTGLRVDAATSETVSKYSLGLDSGTYTFLIKAGGYAPEEKEDVEINNEDNYLINFYLKPQSVINGTVAFSAFGPDDTVPTVTAVREGENSPFWVFTGDWEEENFIINNLAAGTYHLNISREGYIDAQISTSVSEGESIHVGTIQMDAEATISGQVSSPAPGADIDKTVVTVYQNNDSVMSAYCDALGNYTIYNLLPGDYQLKVTTAPGMYTEMIDLSITEGQEVVDQDLLLLPGGAISGTVTNSSTGLPLANIPVLCSNSDGWIGSTYSDANGMYIFTSLAIGDYIVGLPTVSDIGRAEVQIVDLEQEYTADLSLQFEAVLSGIVRFADGTPIAGASVQLMDNDAFIIATLSDSEGRYKFLLNGGGTFGLLASHDGGSFVPLQDIEVSVGESVERDISAGTAYITVGFAPLTQSEESLIVSLYHLIGAQSLFAGALMAQSNTVVNFENLAAGDYRIVATGSESGVGSLNFTLQEGAAETLQLTLESHFTVSGMVKDTNGDPLQKAWINLFSESQQLFQRVDVSLEDGSFNLQFVPSGTYTIIASADGYESVVETDILAGITGPLQLTLPVSTTTVTGRLLSNSGLPIPMGVIRFYTVQDRLVEEASVHPDGTFTFDSVIGTQLRLNIKIAGFQERNIGSLTATAGMTNYLGDITIQPVAVSQGENIHVNVAQAAGSGISTQSFQFSIGGWIDSILDHYPQSPNQLEYSDVPIKPPCCTNCSPLEGQLLGGIIPAQRSAWNWIQSYESDINSQRATVVGLYVGDLAIIAGKCAQLVLIGYGIAGNAGVASAHTAINGVSPGINLANQITGLVDFAHNILQAAISTPTAPSGPQAVADIQTATTWTTRLIGLTNDLEALITGSGIPGNAPHIAGLLGMLADYKNIIQTVNMDNVDQAIDQLIDLESGKAQWVVTYNNRINQGQQVLNSYRNCIQNNCEGCDDDDGDDDDGDGDDDDNGDAGGGSSGNPPNPPDNPNPDSDPYDPQWVQSADPNDIIGPAGFGEEHWVNGTATLPYIIRFENMSDATAPAQRVVITQRLDEDLDYRTFRVTDFGWGYQYTEIDDDLPFYLGRVELTDGSGLVVDVLATVDVVSGMATWILQTIDPATGEPPEDALAGFLPPNDENGIGEGFVSYTIRPRSDATTWSVIDAEATIVFDTNEPIDTPPVFNTIDAVAPTSSVTEATNEFWTANIFVAWGGEDDGGSALKDYNVYVSVDGGPYAIWLLNTTLTSAWFVGEQNHTYTFYCTSQDNAGNVEPFPSAPDASVSIPIYEYEAGDLNHDGYVDLADALIALKVVSGVAFTDVYYLDKEVNADGKIGSEELVYIFQKIASQR